MTNSTLRYILILSILVATVWSCKKEKTTWDADFALPIAQTSLTISQFIADSLLTTDANNHLSIEYTSRILNYNIDSLVNLPDTVTTFSFTSPTSGTINPGQIIALSNDIKSFPFEPARITQVDIKHGFLVLNCINPLATPLKVNYSIPSAKRNGILFQFSETIPASNGNTPSHYTKYIDLSNYSIDMRGPDLNNCNRFQTLVNITTDPNGSQTPIAPGLKFNFDSKFKDLQLEYIKGYLGDEIQTTGPDTNSIDFFKKITSGSISLSGIDVDLKITNGIGADLTIIPQQLTGINTRTHQSTALNGEVIGKSYNITRASKTGQFAFPVNPTITYLNFTNTNILSLLENLPDLLTFKSTIRINPLGNISNGNDFIFSQNGLTADIHMKIPLTFKANTLVLADTITYHIDNSNSLNLGNLTLHFANSFPLSAKIKVYILNENLQITDEITLPNQTVSAGNEDANHLPIASNSTIHINLSEETLKRFIHSEKLLIIAELSTPTSNFASINAHSKIEIKIIGHTNTNIEF